MTKLFFGGIFWGMGGIGLATNFALGPVPLPIALASLIIGLALIFLSSKSNA